MIPKVTPKEITECYSIPIYQRLFEWEAENVKTLLNDLKSSFDKPGDKADYYIGMLTATAQNELVDGQQRFVLMMLMGCVLRDDYPEWEKFLRCKDINRLRFTARSKDNAYLTRIIASLENKRHESNLKMEEGINIIQRFMDKQFADKEARTNFARYVYEHLAFFISQLPASYGPTDLNTYFERMNTTGKNLEQHEILKVKLLSKLEKINENSSMYMQLWNALADETRPIINKELADRKRQVLRADIGTILSNKWVDGFIDSDKPDTYTIRDIAPENKRPQNTTAVAIESRSPLHFPQLLLLALYSYRQLREDDGVSVTEFFKTNRLLDTFSDYLPFEEGKGVNPSDIKSFMEHLTKCRLVLDVCFVRIIDGGYSLDMNLSNEDKEKQNLLMYESMLWVSSDNAHHYQWFNCIMDKVIGEKKFPLPKDLLQVLQTEDRKWHSLPKKVDELRYGTIKRYWFWRLDYLIWLNRETLFPKAKVPEMRRVADNYVFRENRSIEHVAPQTPENDSAFKWTAENERHRDSFGNLVMISSSLNSSLSNSSFEMKRANVESHCKGSKTNTIESLKLLLIYRDHDIWDEVAIQEHGEKMYRWLKDDGITQSPNLLISQSPKKR